MPCTPEEVEACAAVLAKLVPADLSDPLYAPLIPLGHALFGRGLRTALFGEREVVEHLKEQRDSRALLRRLDRVHDIVQRSHAAVIETARGAGINSLREARTHQVNALGLAALTSQASVDTLVHDFLRAPRALGAGAEPAAAQLEDAAEQPLHRSAPEQPLHYSSAGGAAVHAAFRAGGIGRSRGRKAEFKLSRIRGLYEDHAEALAGSGSEGGEEGEEAEAAGAAGQAPASSDCARRPGMLHLLPRPEAASAAAALQPPSPPSLAEAVHPGQWLCYVEEAGGAGALRACAHRTLVDIASRLASLGQPLSLIQGAQCRRALPCTFMVGKRVQRWAFLGGEVEGLCGETAISVRLLSSACSAAGGAGGEGAALPHFSPLPGEFHKHCNVCKAEYPSTLVHAFYHQLCRPCGDFNLTKRMASADLKGHVCLVTGGRVRIGFQIALKLLRAGARVIVTSRFVADAALRFSLESDFSSWGHNLTCDRLELTDLAAVEAYAASLPARFPRIHVLINNAAQTITRDEAWCRRMGQLEGNSGARLASDVAASLLDTPWNRSCGSSGSSAGELPAGGAQGSPSAGGSSAPLQLLLPPPSAPAPASSKSEASEPTQAVASHFDARKGVWETLDESGQPLDSAGVNSWSRRLDAVSTPELVATMAVNSIAPFILCSRLKPLLRPAGTGDPAGHIVNVTSLEGKFNVGKKSTAHPHTNCAKAALNMMTLTSARDYARSRIYVNCVDTGWVTDMAPVGVGAASRQHESFVGPPLDEVDGASRVLDPIFVHVSSGGKEKMVGLFLKDYMSASW